MKSRHRLRAASRGQQHDSPSRTFAWGFRGSSCRIWRSARVERGALQLARRDLRDPRGELAAIFRVGRDRPLRARASRRVAERLQPLARFGSAFAEAAADKSADVSAGIVAGEIASTCRAIAAAKSAWPAMTLRVSPGSPFSSYSSGFGRGDVLPIPLPQRPQRAPPEVEQRRERLGVERALPCSLRL